jgi:hypothetical protein
VDHPVHVGRYGLVDVGLDAGRRQSGHDLRRDAVAVVGDRQWAAAQPGEREPGCRRRDHADRVAGEAGGLDFHRHWAIQYRFFIADGTG